jgi:hypothetical protein
MKDVDCKVGVGEQASSYNVTRNRLRLDFNRFFTEENVDAVKGQICP